MDFQPSVNRRLGAWLNDSSIRCRYFFEYKHQAFDRGPLCVVYNDKLLDSGACSWAGSVLRIVLTGANEHEISAPICSGGRFWA